MNTYNERIMLFQNYLKKAIGIMEMQKKHLKQMMNSRAKHDVNQTTLMQALMKYEDIGLAYYSDQDLEKRILTHPQADDLNERIL